MAFGAAPGMGGAGGGGGRSREELFKSASDPSHIQQGMNSFTWVRGRGWLLLLAALVKTPKHCMRPHTRHLGECLSSCERIMPCRECAQMKRAPLRPDHTARVVPAVHAVITGAAASRHWGRFASRTSKHDYLVTHSLPCCSAERHRSTGGVGRAASDARGDREVPSPLLLFSSFNLPHLRSSLCALRMLSALHPGTLLILIPDLNDSDMI